MSFAPASTCFFPTGDGSIRGSFRNAETDAFFEFSECPEDERCFGPEFNMKVWMSDGTFRFAKVMKTRAFVVVDEADDGSAVTEKWVTKQARFFDAP